MPIAFPPGRGCPEDPQPRHQRGVHESARGHHSRPWVAPFGADLLVFARVGDGLRQEKQLVSESNFAICFLLEIPLGGFPFQMKFSEQYRIPKNDTNLIVKRISFEKEIPSGGSKAGNISQTSCPIVPRLRCSSTRATRAGWFRPAG